MPTQKQFLDEDGLAIVASKVNEKLKVLATMPSTNLTDGLTVLYKGVTTATYKQGHIYKYDLANIAWVDITAGGIPAVTTMPSAPNNDDVVLYIGTTTVTYTANHLYRYSTTDSEWVDLTATVLALYKTTFQGTKAEWDLLSSAEKEQYDVVNLTDDIAEGGAVVVDEVTSGNLNAVTSNAVYDETHILTGLSNLNTAEQNDKVSVYVGKSLSTSELPSNFPTLQESPDYTLSGLTYYLSTYSHEKSTSSFHKVQILEVIYIGATNKWRRETYKRIKIANSWLAWNMESSWVAS